MGSERLIVVIQVLDYLKYSRGLNVSSLFSDFTYKSMELCHILVKDGLKWFAYCQRGQKDSHKIPRKLCLFSPWLSVGIAKEGRQKRQRLTCPLESPVSKSLPPIHICLEKRRRVDQCRFAKYTSSNSDTCISFGESGQHQIRFYNGEMQGYIFNPFPLLLFMLDKVKSPYMSEMG